MFSRTGPFAFVVQSIVGFIARASYLLGAKKLALRIRSRRQAAAESYKRGCIDFFGRIVSSGAYDLLLDFGAHAGEQSFVAAKYMAVQAYEPDPRAIEKFEEILKTAPEINHSLRLFPCAVSTRSGTEILNFSEIRPESTGGSTIATSKSGFKKGENVEVKTIDVLTILEEVSNPRKTIVKMDIEGMEYPVLSRMLESPKFRNLGMVFVEFHERKLDRGLQLGIKLTLNLWRHRMSRRRLIEWH